MHSLKGFKDSELSLNEALKGWKKVNEGLREMSHDNLELSKEYLKYAKDSLGVLHVSF